MSNEVWKETLIEQKVNYTLEMDGNLIVVENVPARLCLETGERFFSPETVERLQQIIWKRNKPSRTLEVPVYEFV
jgi:YgiT-type zinc finger domain-containing protein